MRSFYKIVVIVAILTAILVWFMPGVDLWVEQLVQQIVSRAAR